MATEKEMVSEIRHFVHEHPHGWSHDEWTGLTHHLAHLGHDVADLDGVGLRLEHERLTQVLERMEIKGLGPKRTKAIATHFGTLWNLMSASPEDMARAVGIPTSLANQISEVLQ